MNILYEQTGGIKDHIIRISVDGGRLRMTEGREVVCDRQITPNEQDYLARVAAEFGKYAIRSEYGIKPYLPLNVRRSLGVDGKCIVTHSNPNDPPPAQFEKLCDSLMEVITGKVN